MTGHSDSASLWQCNFNPYSDTFNDIYPKLLEQYEIDRTTFEQFMDDVNRLIKNLKKEQSKGLDRIGTILAVNILLIILTGGIWLCCFLSWYLYKSRQKKSRIDILTESTKWKIGQIINHSNDKIFQPKGLKCVAMFDRDREDRIGTERFIDSFLMIQTNQGKPVLIPKTSKATPSSVRYDYEVYYTN